MPLDVVVDCPGFAESRHAILAYDAAGERVATQLSEGTTTVLLHVVSPSFPLRLVVTGARCSFATTIETTADQRGQRPRISRANAAAPSKVNPHPA